jgi:hypothetical protein
MIKEQQTTEDSIIPLSKGELEPVCDSSAESVPKRPKQIMKPHLIRHTQAHADNKILYKPDLSGRQANGKLAN